MNQIEETRSNIRMQPTVPGWTTGTAADAERYASYRE